MTRGFREIRKTDLKKIWEKVPVNYYEEGIARNLGQRYWHKEKFLTFDKITSGLKPKNILDIGSNAGIMTVKIADRFPHSRITGVDVFKDAINYAKKRYPGIKFMVADAQTLPFNNKEFDLIFCLETLEHIVLPETALNEIYRCLSKEGRVVISMDSGNWLFSIIWFFWTRFGRGRVWRESHLYQFNKNKLKKMIVGCNFIIEKEINSHFGLAVCLMLKKK